MSEKKVISFGQLIRKLRKEAGVPQRVIASQLDIDTSLLGKIERNERYPSTEIILAIAKIFEQDEKRLINEYVSDLVANKVIKTNAGIEVLKTAEKKIEYLKSKINGKVD